MSGIYLVIEGAILANTRPNLPLFIIVIGGFRGSTWRFFFVVVVFEIVEVLLLNPRTGKSVGLGLGLGLVGAIGGCAIDFAFGERP